MEIQEGSHSLNTLNTSVVDIPSSTPLSPEIEPKIEETSSEIHQCPSCDKFLPTKSKLTSHLRSHLKYKCEDCGREFSGSSPLKYHRWIHIGNGVRNFSCQHANCGKRFKSLQDLKRHNLIHSGTRKWKCDKCQSSFYLEWALREHKKIHDGIRPYLCTFENCGKAFYSQKDLKRHKETHETEIPFKCRREGCNKGFRRKDNYLRHLTTTHNMSKGEAKQTADDEEKGTFQMDNNLKIMDEKLQLGLPKDLNSSASLDMLAQVATEQIRKRKLSDSQQVPTRKMTKKDLKVVPFPNAIIFVGNEAVGKSYLCNQILRSFDSPTRFPLTNQNKELHVEQVLDPEDGTNYTIMETRSLFSPNDCRDSVSFNTLEGKNACIVLSTIELCHSVKGIVYVFKDTFTHNDSKTVKVLAELVGFSNVYIFKNKLTRQELEKQNFIASKTCVFNELKKFNVVSGFQDFRLWCVGINQNPEDLGKEWTAPLQKVLKNKPAFSTKNNLKVPEICFEKIVRGKEYETSIPCVENNLSLVERFWKQKCTGSEGVGMFGIPLKEHFLETRIIVNEYKVRYDGNMELFRSIEILEKRRRVRV